jgi:membrane peptidoglycan carboxypeptidase
LAASAVWEVRTSTVQSWFFARWSAELRYTVEIAPSSRIAFPREGPLDERRGYTRLPAFSDRLEVGGYHIAEQAHQAPGLTRLILNGIPPPYSESPVAALVIHDNTGRVMFDAGAGEPVFRNVAEIPPLITQTLLFIENRNIGLSADDQSGVYANPAIDWKRSTKALISYGARKLGIDVPLQGGSTLATQLEKYQHSKDGRTASSADKLRQMLAASLAAYHSGRDTRRARTQIIVDYLNTMPLSATAGIGEIHGLGAGLKAWFDMDVAQVCAALQQPQASSEKARAYRHVLAQLYAVHAPTHFLVEDRSSLEARIDAFAGLLHSAGIIDERLLRLVKHSRLEFVTHAPAPLPPHFTDRKAVNAVRLELAGRLQVTDFYDLDGLDLKADSTIDSALQENVTRLLGQLSSPGFVRNNGLVGPHMLSRGDPAKVIYSFLLLESRPEGNFLRVQTDTLNGPFDINTQMKLELGSTAKLRTLAAYLDIMARLHDELAPLNAAALEVRSSDARDPLTRWAAETLRTEPGLRLEDFLNRALDREYSASPAEVFFTGGGVHHFRNFEPQDNGRIMSVREALVHSTNLVFIRLMRDLVRYHEANLPYDARAVLAGADDAPDRQRLLADIADHDSRQALARTYRRYHGLNLPQILSQLSGRGAQSARDLTIVFYAWNVSRRFDSQRLDASPVGATSELRAWLEAHAGDATSKEVTPTEARRLEHAYGNPRLNLADYAYLLKVNPLDLWCAGEILREPQVSWSDLFARSAPARQVASAWLFKTRNRKAQDLRLRIRIERDAFVRMTPYWRELGFPFESLVPSYATAIGSSADRPAALAELMGIIVNDGRRRPTFDIGRLTFAAGTPYHTSFESNPSLGAPVMRPVVARLLRNVLSEVVESGTAWRLHHAFVDNQGIAIPIGGKTGSGDNRIEAFARGGLYLGERWFGMITATVDGPQAAQYVFTSSLPLAVLKLLAPTLIQATVNSGPQEPRASGEVLVAHARNPLLTDAARLSSTNALAANALDAVRATTSESRYPLSSPRPRK